MITVVVGKEIEKIKGDFESYLNGLNMVGEISYSQYSKLYDEGTKQMQRAYELGKSELEKENAELKERVKTQEQLTKAKEIIKELSKSLFLAKGTVRDLIDDTVDFKESKDRAIYCYEQEKFDIYKQAEQFLKESE